MTRHRSPWALVAVTVALLLGACAGGGGGTASNGPQTASDASDADGAGGGGGGEPYRVALLSPGTQNNGSWANAWWNGAEQAMEELDVEVEFVGPLDNPDQYLQQGSAFASQGFDFVIFANGAMRDPAIQVAQQFPDALVCQAPYHPPSDEDLAALPENMCVVDVEQQDATFLAGILAGLVSQTGHVASVNGFAFPALTRQPESFSLGARCVDADVEFSQQYIQSWDDTGIAKAAAQQMIAAGADVILAATDQAYLGVVEAAREAPNQVWVVPSYFDTHEEAPDVILTSAIHGLEQVSLDLIGRAVDGGIEPASFIDYDVTNTETIQTAPLYDNADVVGQDAVTRFEELAEATRQGEITVPDETIGETPIGTEGSAADIDPASLGCGA